MTRFIDIAGWLISLRWGQDTDYCNTASCYLILDNGFVQWTLVVLSLSQCLLLPLFPCFVIVMLY